MKLHGANFLTALCIIFLFAQPSFAAERTPSVEQLNKKVTLVEYVLVDIKRKGGDLFSKEPMFIAGYEYAQGQLEKAKAALATGDLAVAQSALDEAFVNITYTRSFLQKKAPSKDAEIKQYHKQKNAVTEYVVVLKDVLANKSDEAAKETLKQAEQVLMSAEGLVNQAKYSQAIKTLDDAYQQLITTLTRVQDKETSVVSLNFATPKDEFDYEMNRLESFRMLLKLRHQNAKISDNTAKLMAKYTNQSEQDVAEAQKLSKQGNFGQAIKMVESANDNLKRALRMSGLNML